MPIFKPVNNKPQHTFTWLKVFACFFIAGVLCLTIFINLGSDFPVENAPTTFRLFNSFVFTVVGITCLAGLILGFLLNLLTKFRRPVVVYVAGQVLAIIFCIVFVYMQFKDSPFVHLSSPDTTLSQQAMTVDPTDTTTIFKGDEKHAIEEVLYLMEQQYPFGAYVLEDIITKPGNKGTVCTIVFTLSDEGDKKYISQYIVNEGAPQPVYIKKDTTSAGYIEYKLERTGQ